MSAYGISRPSFSQTRLYLIRPPSSAWTCRKLMSFSSVAEYSLIGMVTKPKEIAPFQMDRGMGQSLPDATDIGALEHHFSPPTQGDSAAAGRSDRAGQRVQLFGGVPEE